MMVVNKNQQKWKSSFVKKGREDDSHFCSLDQDFTLFLVYTTFSFQFYLAKKGLIFSHDCIQCLTFSFHICSSLLESWRRKWQQRVMGQAESTATATNESPRDDSQPPSMEDLIAEAAAYGDDENEVISFLSQHDLYLDIFSVVPTSAILNLLQSLDAKAKKALDCPCIAHLRSGPCGNDFSEAFLCYLKSTAEEKGSDCVHPFVMLQSCIKAHPDAFSKDVLEDEQVEKEVNPSPEPKVIPPRWSMESQDTKSKL